MLTQVEVEAAIQAVAARLPNDRRRFIPDGENRDAGYPFVRVQGDVYLYLSHERGRETFRRETHDLDELMWFVFHDVTRQLAMTDTGRRGSRRWPSHRRRDTRRRWFPRWVSLMTELKPAWGARTQAHIDEVLARNPYLDR